ncbi:helix-turn-helix domain-containing protein, partial [Arthrobacter sp. ISL-69]|uniref:helix-turn-helix domain-containing protein n=1 Tax=Arthrobacter sp. ISL-69 TaxID=2819113 RepID=UPI001C1527B1
MTNTVPRRGQANTRKADPQHVPGQPTSVEAKRRIVDAYQGGVSIKGIMATFGHAKGTVHKALSEAGVQLRDDAVKPKISREELVQRHSEGWTPRMIADSCGAHIGTIHERLSQLGLSIGSPVATVPSGDALAAARETGRSVRSLALIHRR